MFQDSNIPGMADIETGHKPTHSVDARPLGPDGRPLPGPAQMQQIMAQKRMAQQQAQVDEVVGIMRNNVEKVLERDQKLNELDEQNEGDLRADMESLKFITDGEKDEEN